jgi:hypothetical protein
VHDLLVTDQGVLVLMAEFVTDDPEAAIYARYVGRMLRRFDLDLVEAAPLAMEEVAGCLANPSRLAAHPDGVLMASATSCGDGWGAAQVHLTLLRDDDTVEPVGTYGIDTIDYPTRLTVASDGRIAVYAEHQWDALFGAGAPYWFIVPPGGCTLEPDPASLQR